MNSSNDRVVTAPQLRSIPWGRWFGIALAVMLAMAVGIVLSSVWNYFLNLDLTWSGHARPE
jgi:hypothetical protein